MMVCLRQAHPTDTDTGTHNKEMNNDNASLQITMQGVHYSMMLIGHCSEYELQPPEHGTPTFLHLLRARRHGNLLTQACRARANANVECSQRRVLARRNAKTNSNQVNVDQGTSYFYYPQYSQYSVLVSSISTLETSRSQPRSKGQQQWPLANGQ